MRSSNKRKDGAVMTPRNILRSLFLIAMLAMLGLKATAQTKHEIEERIRASADSVEAVAKSLPESEKKIEWNVLQQLNKMLAENAASIRGTSEMKGRYSSKRIPVDEDGQIYLNVQLLLSSIPSDTLVIVQRINSVGGKVTRVFVPNRAYPIEIYCWVPFDAIKAVALLPNVGNIRPIGFPVTRTGDVTSLGDSQMKVDLARDHIYASGSGVNVGVISDGVTSWQSIPNGNLPTTIQVLGAGAGSLLSSGVYIIHFSTPTYSTAKRIIAIR
ncbi:MAG: hypothetical protein ACRDGA_04370 [Bacteroidota bacterium]